MMMKKGSFTLTSELLITIIILLALAVILLIYLFTPLRDGLFSSLGVFRP